MHTFLPQFLKRFYLFIFREREGGIKKGKETSVFGYLLSPPTGVLAHNPRMCLRLGIEQETFVSQAGTQSTEPHQPGVAQIFEGKIRTHIIHWWY